MTSKVKCSNSECKDKATGLVMSPKGEKIPFCKKHIVYAVKSIGPLIEGEKPEIKDEVKETETKKEEPMQEENKSKKNGKFISSVNSKEIEHDSFEDAFKRVFIDMRKLGVVSRLQLASTFVQTPEGRRINYNQLIDNADEKTLSKMEKSLKSE